MNDSIRLGTIRGITIRLHYSVLVILAFVLLFAPGAATNALLYVALLAPIVLLHELGHGVVAQHFGIRVLDITFWPLGGMARMNEIPEDARIEGWIAIAGPLVNLALALAALPFALLPGLGGQLALIFSVMNLMLGAFNLLPAFPMDGGRVLRAWLGRKGDWLGATERAVRVGRSVAVLMIVAGFFVNPVLALVGLFVWWTGSQELYAVRVRHQGPPAWSFGPFRMFWPNAGAPGAATAPRAARAEPSATNGGRARVFEARPVESAGARRPDESTGPRGRGFSAEELSRLERFPGPLRQFDSET